MLCFSSRGGPGEQGNRGLLPHGGKPAGSFPSDQTGKSTRAGRSAFSGREINPCRPPSFRTRSTPSGQSPSSDFDQPIRACGSFEPSAPGQPPSSQTAKSTRAEPFPYPSRSPSSPLWSKFTKEPTPAPRRLPVIRPSVRAERMECISTSIHPACGAIPKGTCPAVESIPEGIFSGCGVHPPASRPF